MRGRKPKPTALKLVTGNPGKRKLNAKEPKPARVIPSPPDHLSDAARVAWGSLATRLDRLGLLTELDAFALEQLCENYVEILDLRAAIAKHGRTQSVETQYDTVVRARPEVGMLSNAERRFRAMMAEFGLTPSARSRVTATPDDASHSDPAAAYGL
jgi:P27 family predicted phage terminase small subunit